MVLNLTVQNSPTIYFTHTPRFLHSNGEDESGFRTVKNLLSKERDPAKGLLAYRSTPLEFKFSPAQLLMGRQMRNSVPVFHTQLHPQWPDLENLREKKIEHEQAEAANSVQQQAQGKAFTSDWTRYESLCEGPSAFRESHRSSSNTPVI